MSPTEFRVLEAAPGPSGRRPGLTIVAVTDTCLRATMTMREQIEGRQLFDVSPTTPNDPAASDATAELCKMRSPCSQPVKRSPADRARTRRIP